jgi:phosphate transport system substrate-binding protein
MGRRSPDGDLKTKGLLVLVAAAVALVGCVATAGWSQSPTAPDAVSLRGAGSTFAAPLYRKWIEEYAALHPNVSIGYDAVGSGEGVRRFLADTLDFAGSDEILDDRETAEAGGAITVPMTAGMVVIAYNVSGLPSGIKLPRDVYLDIFAGVIKQWDDARIQAANPGIVFPHRTIGVIARQDGSGTTAAFTRHLDAIGSEWRDKGMNVGKLVEWPKGTTLAPGNEGVASKIKASEGSIGYVEFWYVQNFGLQMATLQNKAGRFIAPSADTGELALTGRVALVKQLDISVADPATSGAYPIPSYSWMLLYPHYRDATKGAALRDFVEWGLSQQAQEVAAELGYLALPADVIGLGTQTLAHLTYSK